jgi:chemosensory pili system protein ChpA (sensor histidine kinase/response regulator)
MKAASKIDPSTLGWVKAEIDETMRQARLALESFAENPSDTSHLRFCVTYLHQVAGTLKMVELDGPAQLAQETERLAEAVLQEQTSADAAALEALTRGILALPDYLARLQFGEPDVPLRLLSRLNELRAARGAPPFTGLDLFNPDLTVRPPAGGYGRLTEAEFIAALKNMRPAFQAALLNWLREPQNPEHAAGMADVLATLQGQSHLGVVEQLLWVAGGLLAALISGDLEISNERKKLLSRVDQQIKKLIDGTEKINLRASTEALTKAILFELMHAKAGADPVRALKQAFDLDALATGETETDLPAPEVLQSVAAALGKEIESAQELLTGYFGTSDDDRTFEPLLALLEKMSRALSVLGVAPLKALIDELAETVRAIMQGAIEGSESVAMQLAGSLLLVEHSAREIPSSGAAWKKHIDEGIDTLRRLRAGDTREAGVEGIEISDAELTDTEFKQLLGAVAGEIRVNLAKVEEGLERFAAAPADTAAVQSLPQYLSQIQGALQIVGQDRAAELTVVASGHVQDLMHGARTPSRPVFEALAVAIGTIGAYLEGLERDRPNLAQMLDVAFQDLEAATNARPFSEAPRQVQALGKQFERWLEDPSNPEMPAAMRQGVSDLGRLAQQHAQHKLEQVCTETGHLLTILVEDGAQMSDEVRATLQQSLATLGDLVERGEALVAGTRSAAQMPDSVDPVMDEEATIVVEEIALVASAPESASVVATGGLELDEEIMPIFIEDAKEMLNLVAAHLEAWIESPDNREALSELRRAFHTLKGSGRMVGASAIAELAWALENLLTRIRENQIDASEPIFALLREVRAVLPLMIGQIEGGPAVQTDIEALRTRAQALAAGEMPPAPPAAKSAPIAAVASATSSAPPVPVIDPVLLQIFTIETGSHLATIRESLTTAPVVVSHSLLRAAHTLQGSSRSLGLLSMADACGELERLLQAAEIRHLPLSAQARELLLRTDQCVNELVAALHDGNAMTLALHEKFAALAQALAAETEHLSVYPPVHQDDDAPPSAPAAKPKSAPALTPVSAEAPRPAAAPAIEERIDPELLDIFHEEATDILESIEEALTRWRSNHGNKAVVHDLKRHLHTLKGSARMAGAMTMGSIGHHTESLLKQVEDNKITVDDALLDLLDEVHDDLVNMIDRLQHNRPMTQEAAALDAKLAARLEGRAAPTAELQPAPADTHVDTSADTRPSEIADEEARDEDADQPFERPERREQIKVRTSLLNDLVNHAGEVSIARSRMEQQIFGLREHLGELNGNVMRFRHQLRELEIQAESQILYRAEREGTTGIGADFDPLEFDRFSKLQHLSRGLAESLHDLSTIQQTLDNFAAEAETALQQQARVNTELQEGLMRTRMIGFATQAGRLRHIVRQTARELGKRAEFEIKGADVELDRTVLERMIGPLEHMIRNALDHGLEDDEARRRAGKPVVGKITIETTHEGSEVVLRFADDGAGLDVAAIRRKAIERELMQSSTDLTDEEIVQFILLPGFSTAKKITHLSGRGVGMDVVQTEVKQLGGSITVNSERGAGTVFIIRLPLTLSITQALMVHVGEQLFAIPLGSIVNLLEVPASKLNSLKMGEKPLFHYEDQVYPFMHLGARLGIAAQPRSSKKVAVLLAKTGARQIALQVDAMGSTREVVIKSLGPQISAIKGISGATILGDGRVVLILDVGGLWMDEAMQVVQLRSQPREAEVRSPVVMVVDDSLTVRKITTRHLQRHGLDVMVAKDGLDAMEQLREQVPDIMLVDIEMPRMDGYELTANVRSDAALRHVPIIMITSRAGTKHRDRAMQLGVNFYMSKPYQEDELMRNIHALIAEQRTPQGQTGTTGRG